MATQDQQFIDGLILTIEQAEDPESVTNTMVAAVLDYLNESYKDLLTNNEGITQEKSERMAADAAINRTIDTINVAIQSIRETAGAAKSKAEANELRINTILNGDSVTAAIDTFNEIKAFLEGVTNTDSFLGLLNDIRERLDDHADDITRIKNIAARTMEFNCMVEGVELQPAAGASAQSTDAGCMVVYDRLRNAFLLAALDPAYFNIGIEEWEQLLQAFRTRCATGSSIPMDGDIDVTDLWEFDDDGTLVGPITSAFLFHRLWDDAADFGSKSTSEGQIPDAGKTYTCTADRKAYRWNGEDLTPEIFLGHEEGTAFPGDEGKKLQDAVKNLDESHTLLSTRVKDDDMARVRFLDLNFISGHSDPYASLGDTLEEVPGPYRRYGAVVRVLLSKTNAAGNTELSYECYQWTAKPTDKFTNWENPADWEPFGSAGSADGNCRIIENYVKDTLNSGEDLCIENYPFEDGGFYYINEANKITSMPSTAAAVCKIIKPIKVYKGDLITITTRSSLANRPIWGFINKDTFTGTDVVEDPGLPAKGNAWGTYEIKVKKDRYLLITQSGDSFSEGFNIKITSGHSDRLNSLESTVSKITPCECFGVRNGGPLTSSADGGKVDTTVELFFRLDDVENDINIYSTGSTYMFWVKYFAFDNRLMLSFNNGSYETRSILNVEKDTLFHIIFVFDTGANVKQVYLNGDLLSTSGNGNNPLGNLKDAIYSQTFFIKRIWNRALSACEIKELHNGGYPTDFTLTDSIRESLVSNYEPRGIRESGWYDSAEDTLTEFSENVILDRTNPNNIYSDFQELENRTTALEGSLARITDSVVENPIEEIIYPQFDTLATARSVHDCTFIGDDFVSTFYEGGGTGNLGNSSFRYINLDNGTLLKEVRARFLEKNSDWKILQLKSVDYKFDKLLIGTGRALLSGETSYEEQGSYLYIFNEAGAWKDGDYTSSNLLTFENCGSYNEIDVSELGVKVYGFWAQRKDSIYVSCNFFRDVYLIQLGLGATNLGKGNFVSAGEGEYNGSYAIINHWHQNHDWESLGQPMAAHGGQFYKGYLYMATNNTRACEIFRCKLKHDGTLKFDAIYLNEYLSAGANSTYLYKYQYIDGMAIKDNILYAQPLIEDKQYKNTTLLTMEL